MLPRRLHVHPPAALLSGEAEQRGTLRSTEYSGIQDTNLEY